MCIRPFVARNGTHYVYVQNIPRELTDNDIYNLFEAAHPISHLEVHRCYEYGEEVDSHCFIGFRRLLDAVYAMNMGPKGNFDFSMSIITAGFNIAYNH